MYSPVLLDHPVFDTYDYPSDWEYYSDDYYDDDPSVVRKNNEPRKKKSSIAGKPKKKRKLTPTDEIPSMDLGEPVDNKMVNPDNFKGVVWRNSNHIARKGELYEPGQGEAVALLKNWREVFKNSQPRSDRRTQVGGQGRKPGKGKISAKNESIYDADGDERLGDEVSQTFTPPPCSLATLDGSAKPSKRKGKGSKLGGSKLNNVMSISNEHATNPKLKTKTTLPTRLSQPISHPSVLPSDKGEFFSHVEIREGKDLSSYASEAPRPAATRKRKASTSLEEEEEGGDKARKNTNGTTRGKSKRLMTSRKKIGDEGDTAPSVARASSTASSSTRGRPRGRPRGRGRGKRS